MRVICPNCEARYNVERGAIPKQGRRLQCSTCGQVWFYAFQEDSRGDFDQHPPHISRAEKGGDAILDEMPHSPSSRLDPHALALLKEEVAREISVRRQEMESAPSRQGDHPPSGMVKNKPASVQAYEDRPGHFEIPLEYDEDAESFQNHSSTDKPDNSGVLTLWVLVILMLVLVGAVALYTQATLVGQYIPEVVPALTQYVQKVDESVATLSGFLGPYFEAAKSVISPLWGG